MPGTPGGHAWLRAATGVLPQEGSVSLPPEGFVYNKSGSNEATDLRVEGGRGPTIAPERRVREIKG